MSIDITNYNILMLWEYMINVGYDVYHNKRNGYDEWQIWKSILSNMKLPNYDNLDINQNIIKIIKDHLIIKNDKNEYVDCCFYTKQFNICNNEKEIYHFFIQMFRISLMSNYRLSLLKLLQIAYNIGQYNAARIKKEYIDDINNFFDEHNLGNLETFINKKYFDIIPIVK